MVWDLEKWQKKARNASGLIFFEVERAFIERLDADLFELQYPGNAAGLDPWNNLLIIFAVNLRKIKNRRFIGQEHPAFKLIGLVRYIEIVPDDELFVADELYIQADWKNLYIKPEKAITVIFYQIVVEMVRFPERIIQDAYKWQFAAGYFQYQVHAVKLCKKVAGVCYVL